MNGINFFILAGIFAATLTGAQGKAETNRLSEFQALEGCWEVKAAEANTIGEGFKQSGFIAVRSILDGQALEIRRHFEVTEATGLYTGLSKIRQSRQEIAFDEKSGLLITTNTRPESTVPTISKAAISADGRSIFRTFMFYHPRREITLFGEDYLTIQSAEEVTNVTEIKDAFGEYRETYRATWKRLSKDANTCIPEAP